MGMLEKLPDWPASMDRASALKYTGVGETVLETYERLGIVTFKPVGPRGCKVARKADLQRMLDYIFERGDGLPVDESMDLA